MSHEGKVTSIGGPRPIGSIGWRYIPVMVSIVPARELGRNEGSGHHHASSGRHEHAGRHPSGQSERLGHYRDELEHGGERQVPQPVRLEETSNRLGWKICPSKA